MAIRVELTKKNIADSASWTASSAITSDQAAPTVVGDGVACGGLTRLLAGVHTLHADTTDYSLWIYVWNGTAWMILGKINNCGANPVVQEFDISDFTKFYLRVKDLAGTTKSVISTYIALH